ncbi:UNVERIFIED_CONTAM: hypothetical protein FKN15_044267 [Acipenser sinensis]
MATAAASVSDVLGMEEKKFEYFSSINPMAKKIMLERQRIREKHGSEWEKLSQSEQETAIDNWMMDPQIRARYALHRAKREEVVCYPKLLIQTGQKIVHFGEESQLEFSLTSQIAPEQGSTSSQMEPKLQVKTSQPMKASHGNSSSQVAKASQGSKTPSTDGIASGRKEEESSFWKISAERSRLEGGQADFQSLTPSQIKSLEKGEKKVPSYRRQESTPKEKEEYKADKPQLPKQDNPVSMSVSSTVAEWERPQPAHLDDVFTPGPEPKSSTHTAPAKDNDKEESAQAENPFFSQLAEEMPIAKDEEQGPGPTEAALATTPLEDTFSYILSRLADMDSAIHRLNVFQYNLDVKLSQLSDKVIRMDAKVGKIQDETESISRVNKENHREIGRLEGCLKGHRVVRKCFLVSRAYETYAGAVERCRERGGRIAMPKDKRELAALAKYTREFFHPGNWPLWIGVSDRRSEGLYLFEDGIRVTFFQWHEELLSSQPDGGKRENCVTLTSDDGDWWDNDCERRTYFACEFDG